MGAVAKHQRQRADVRQRFLLLGFLRLACGRGRDRFGRPIVPIVGAFDVSLFTPIAVTIIGRLSLLSISLLALNLVRFLCCVLWKPAGFINRCPNVIPTNAENIDYPGTTNRRWIASTAQWRADWREHSVTRVLTSLCGRQTGMARRHVARMHTGARANA